MVLSIRVISSMYMYMYNVLSIKVISSMYNVLG